MSINRYHPLLIASIFALQLLHGGAPYDLLQFRDVLDDSKLQAPTSRTLVKQGEFSGFSHDCFQLNDAGQMTFTMTGASNRSELRQMVEWETGTPKAKTIKAHILLNAADEQTPDEYTFIQIHDSLDTPNAPLLRLAWRQNYRQNLDHIWAIVRTQIAPRRYQIVDLGERPTSGFDIEVTVKENLMSVTVNGHSYIDQMDVSHWDGLSSYFKSGVYLQGTGTARVMFDSLTYSYE